MTEIVYRCAGQLLKDSRWGKIAAFQSALSEALRGGGRPGVLAEGIFAKQTRDGIVALLGCPGYEELAALPVAVRDTIHTALWAKLLPGTPLPDVLERAFVLALSHENIDYDRVEWNYGRRDDPLAMTWGPFGATVGRGNEVRAILKKVQAREPGLLREVFAHEFPTVLELMSRPAAMGHTVLLPVYTHEERRKVWKTMFKALTGVTVVREVYDAHVFSDAWLGPLLKRLYSRLIPDAPARATEVDYAFFLDHLIQRPIRLEGLDRCAEALAAREQAEGPLTPAERRRTIGMHLEPGKRPEDRLGRDVVYYIDALGIERLTPEEREAWQKRTGRRASDCGLSDARGFWPGFMGG